MGMKNNTKKTYIVIAIIVVIAALLLIFWPTVSAMFFKSETSSNPPVTANPVACTEEAKLCSDGTSVVRSGPKCEFAACPVVKEEKTAGLGQRIFNGGVYITPLKVVSDSRCPASVVCISAGNVTLSVKLEAFVETKTVDLNLTNSVDFVGKKIVLTNVSPLRASLKPILNSDYRFTFSVTPIGVMPQ